MEDALGMLLAAALMVIAAAACPGLDCIEDRFVVTGAA